MATTATYAGQLSITGNAGVTFSGDTTGSRNGKIAVDITYDPAGGDAPTMSAFLTGCVTVPAGSVDIELAHPTDPFSTGGDSVPYETTIAGKKLKSLVLKNVGAANVVVTRTSGNELPIFDGDDVATLEPDDVLVVTKKSGTAALVNGTNDGLTFTAAAESEIEVWAVFGP